ncbi:MAG TPA: TonB-dependent receptor [Steroidobacteraceae bacterium]|nr:TonB-dependent receptor [Steroidobacteraceae bacterium]
MGARNRLMVCLGTAAFWNFAATAADQPPQQTEGLAEITVTAQKRTESVQNVPLSITTFGGKELEQKAITDFFDYGTKVPNLAFAMTGDGIGTARTISIRGISGDNTTGFYIDDTPLPDSIDPRVLDIDHIEVLRGPQGTLYGARSMGGTVRIITKTPDLTNFSADIHGGLSDTWNTDRPNYTGDAVVNIPLIEDRLALRLSGFYDDEAGYFKRSYCTNINSTANNLNAAPTCTPLSVNTNPAAVSIVDNVGAIKTYGGAAALTFKPTDNLTITPRIITQRAEYNGFPMADAPTDRSNGYGYPVPAPFVPPPLPTLHVNDFMQARMFNLPEGGYDTWSMGSLGVKWHTDFGDVISSTAYFSRKVWETEDQSDWLFAQPLGGYQAIPDRVVEVKDYQRFVEEIRFVSQLSGPMQFVAGGFFSDLHGQLPFAAYYPPNDAPGFGNILVNVFNLCPPNAAPGTYFCPNPKNPDEIFGTNYQTSVKEPAAFGEVSYEFAKAWKATVGLRWSQVKTTAGGYQEGAVTESVQNYYAGVGQLVDPPVTTKESSTTPKIQLDYHVNPDVMVYTTAAKGFRPGGLVPSVPAALCGTQLPAGVSIDETRQYKSDSLWNYELGLKSAWFDHRLTLNAAAFYIDWKNIQQLILLGCGFQYRANAGAATSKGGEIEVNARPIQPLQFSFGVGYQDAKITKAGSDSPQQPGDPVFEVPDVTANAAITWTQPIMASGRLVPGIDYAYVGRSFSANNLSGLNGFTTRERPGYDVLNARIAFESDRWEVAFVGKNLANQHANLADSRSIGAETPGRPRLVTNQPQTIGLEFRTHF